MVASAKGHGAVVSTLIKEGNIDVNKADKKGWTALMLASQNGHDAVVSHCSTKGMQMQMLLIKME